MFWGGREGFHTLLNTDVKRELDHLGSFFRMVVGEFPYMSDVPTGLGRLLSLLSNRQGD